MHGSWINLHRLGAFGLVVLLTAVCLAGDTDVASALLKDGKEALSKKKYDDAIVRFEKARAADPACVEALYWIAFSRDKKGDAIAAIDGYRDYLRIAGRLEEDGRLGNAERDLVKKARTRLTAVAPGEAEARRVHDAFVDEMLAFARSQGPKDPAIGFRVLEVLDRTDPERADVKAFHASLTGAGGAGGESPAGALPAPLRGSKPWRDLLQLRTFGGDAPPRMEYSGGLMIVDRAEGGFIFRTEPYPTTGAFALDLEFRLVRAHDPAWAFGFGLQPDSSPHPIAIAVKKGELVLAEQLEGEDFRIHAHVPVDLKKPDRWHRLAVLVRRNRVEAWFDGEKKLTATVDLPTLEGKLGLWQSLGRVEVRRAAHAPWE